MTIKELRNFIYENCYVEIGFTKENNYYIIKPQKLRFIILCNQINKTYSIIVIPKNSINLI